MKSISVLSLVVAIFLTTSSLSAPIPVLVEECSDYASCKPYRPRLSIQSEVSSPFQEPYFPAEKVEYSEHTDTAEVGLLEHHTGAPIDQTQLDSQNRNPSSNNRKFNEDGFAARVNKKMQLAAPTQIQRCSMVGPTVESRMRHKHGRMTVTYTYGYSYIRTDYTSVLVVSIVVVFMLCILIVELLSNAIETTRAFFGFDQGAIRLEDCDCEPSKNSSPCIHAPRAFRLMPAGPLRSEKFPPRTSDEVKNEKSPELETQIL